MRHTISELVARKSKKCIFRSPVQEAEQGYDTLCGRLLSVGDISDLLFPTTPL